VYRWLLGQTPDIHCQGMHSGGTNTFKGNATVLKNNTNVNSLPCTGANQDVKAVHFISALNIKVNRNYILRFKLVPRSKHNPRRLFLLTSILCSVSLCQLAFSGYLTEVFPCFFLSCKANVRV
jgi:hypothetical protein